MYLLIDLILVLLLFYTSRDNSQPVTDLVFYRFQDQVDDKRFMIMFIQKVLVIEVIILSGELCFGTYTYNDIKCVAKQILNIHTRLKQYVRIGGFVY